MQLIDGKAISEQVKQEKSALIWPPFWWGTMAVAKPTWPIR